MLAIAFHTRHTWLALTQWDWESSCVTYVLSKMVGSSSQKKYKLQSSEQISNKIVLKLKFKIE